MIWIKIFAVVGILACAVILVAVGGVVVTAIQDRRQRRFARLDDRIAEINMWLTDNQKRHDDLEERISLCKASVDKHIGYLDTVYDVLKWNVKDLDFERIRHIENMMRMLRDIDTVHHNRITALELRLDNNSAEDNIIHTEAPE